MANIERSFPGFQWAEPLKGGELEVIKVDNGLQIFGRDPSYKVKDCPCDLIQEYEGFPKRFRVGNKSSTESPETVFANANTDAALIAFVRRFGPVVAMRAGYTAPDQDSELQGSERIVPRLSALQDMDELRQEQAIYRAALELIKLLHEADKGDYDHLLAEKLVAVIAAGVQDWPRQWERESSSASFGEPYWKLKSDSLERINFISRGLSDPFLPKVLDGRIVICELINCFPPIVFASVFQLRSCIHFGIRPLLYALLRRHLLYPRMSSVCLNGGCRNFFNIERAGQQFCGELCSRLFRQRKYWQEHGKEARQKRLSKKKKRKKTHSRPN